MTKEAQEEAIYQLNQNVLKTNANKAETDLINGWYEAGHTQDTMFVPSTMDADFYRKVIARNCRTCHIAQRDQDSIKDLNFSQQGVNLGAEKPGASGRRINPTTGQPQPIEGELKWFEELVCGQTNDLLRAFAMPNSKVTFDLFWLSQDAVQALRKRTRISDCQNPKAPPVP